MTNSVERSQAGGAMAAVGLVILDAIGAGIAFLFVLQAELEAGWDDTFGGSGSGSGSLSGQAEEGSAQAFLVAFGCLAALAAVSCALLAWGRAPAPAVVQGLAAGVFALVAFGGAAVERAESQPDPAPVSDYDDYDGPGGPCLSGGDNDECEGTSG